MRGAVLRLVPPGRAIRRDPWRSTVLPMFFSEIRPPPRAVRGRARDPARDTAADVSGCLWMVPGLSRTPSVSPDEQDSVPGCIWMPLAPREFKSPWTPRLGVSTSHRAANQTNPERQCRAARALAEQGKLQLRQLAGALLIVTAFGDVIRCIRHHRVVPGPYRPIYEC